MSAFADANIVVDECIPLLKKTLEWDNPEYYKRQEKGLSTWNTPQKIVLWQAKGNKLVVPFGMLQFLWKSGINVIPSEHLTGQKKRFSAFVDGLYDYQTKAFETALKAKNGVLVAPCGSGKTQIGLAICGALGYRTLWLTHTHDLLKQSMGRAKECLGSVPMGTITEGKINASNGITFATVQTMAKIDLAEFHDFWDVIIVDECHRCIGSPTRLTMFYKVVSSLSARYKFGLTATPKRTDGMERAMFALLGEKFFEITKEDVKDKICNVHVQAFETNYEPNYDSVLMPDGTLNYSELVNDLIQNEERFQKVLDVINKLSSPILVLSSRVSYAQKLSDAYNGMSICLSALGQSKKAKIIRQDALSKLNNGELEAVFCTYQLASEGLDVPSLRYVVFATPEKNLIRIQQSTGRVSRKADGKQCGTVIDFIDDFRMYKGWWVKRKSIYKKLGYDII